MACQAEVLHIFGCKIYSIAMVWKGNQEIWKHILEIWRSRGYMCPAVVVVVIDIFNIYKDHNLPSVVTRDLDLSHESRLVASHSQLTIHDSRLSMLCDPRSAD